VATGTGHIYVLLQSKTLTLWHWNFLLNFSTPCI